MNLANAIPDSIAIIGAGIAGLSCAKVLQDAGLRVQLFEQGAVLGGRMGSDAAQCANADIGAQYFTARGEAFQRELEIWCNAGVAALWPVSVAEIHTRQKSAPRQAATSVSRYVGVPVMASPLHYLANLLPVHTHSEVEALQRDEWGWQIYLRDQGVWHERFDAVVFAIPAPQVLSLLPEQLQMVTPLLAEVSMQSTWTLVVTLEDGVSLGFDAAFVNAGPFRWIARQQSKPGRSCGNHFVLHANSQWSDAHHGADAAHVMSLLVAEFTALFGAKPLAAHVHWWQFADTRTPLGCGYFWLSEFSVGICGDWLLESKVESAWNSGARLAQRLLRLPHNISLDVKLISVKFGGELYQQALRLRTEILRKPLGRSLDLADLEGEETQHHFVLMNENASISACLCARKIEKNHYKLRQMAVASAFQQQGLGTRLLDQVEQYLFERGANHLSLHARETAIGFYEKNGYTIVGELFDEVGIPHIKMEKKCSEITRV